MWYYPFSAIFIAISSLLLAILVWSKKKSELAVYYSIFTFFIVVWSFSYFMWLISDTYNAALFWTRALTVGSIFLPITFLHFVIVFVGKKDRLKNLLIAGYIFFTIIFLFDFTPLVVRTVEPALSFPFWPKPGILYHPYLLVFFATFILSYYLLYRNYKKSQGLKKDQARLVFVGTYLSLLLAVPNWFLWYGILFPPITNIFSALFVYFIGYAIIRHRFLDIRLALKQSTVFLLSLVTVFAPSILASVLIYDWLPQYYVWASIALMLAVILIFNPLRRYYGHLANKYFFTSLYDSGHIISALNEKLKMTIEADEIYRHLTGALADSLHIKSLSIFSRHKGAENYTLVYRYGANSTAIPRLLYNEYLEENFFKKNKIATTDEIIHYNDFSRQNEIINDFAAVGIEVLIPLTVKNELIGIIALGEKESRDTYKQNDLDFLEIVSYQISFALNNAMLYARAKAINAELQKEKEKTAAIVDNLIDPILVIDKNDRLIMFNQAARRIFRLDASRIFEKVGHADNYSMDNFKNLFGVNFRSSVLNTGKNGGAQVEETVIEADNTSDNGPESAVENPFRVSVDIYAHNELIFKVTTTPIYDKSRKLLGHMKIFYDLTRERMVDMLKSEFVSIAAHQLRTPLSAIKWALKMVLDGDEGKITPGQESLLLKGYANNERVINLINDMLDASRIEEGKYGFKFAEENIVSVLDQVIKKYEVKIKEKHLNFNFDCEAKNEITLIDADKIAIALGHILDNAIEYTPDKGKVSLKLGNDGRNIVIGIADGGVGIPVKERGKLFTKFFRGENVVRMQTDGSGLGLFIAHNIIESHHGRMEITSEENKGTKVLIKLPIKF